MAQYDMTVQHEGGAREALGKRNSSHDMRPEGNQQETKILVESRETSTRNKKCMGHFCGPYIFYFLFLCFFSGRLCVISSLIS
jgi:hypothetical protein